MAADSAVALTRPDDLVGAIGRFLTLVHAEPVPPGADDRSAPAELAAASLRVAGGEADAVGFDPPYAAQDPARLLEIATGLWERCGHGWGGEVRLIGAGLAGLEVEDGEVCGWPDASVALRGDPYSDLARLARDLSVAIGPAAVPALFDSCGIERPDPARIEFWILLLQLL